MPASLLTVTRPSHLASFLLVWCLLTGVSAGTTDGPPLRKLPFASGERFTYRVSWMGLHAATAVMEVAPASMPDGRRALRLLTTATSSPVVTTFYPVDNRVESLVDAESLTPLRLLFRRREGKRRNDFDVTFQHAQGTALSIKDGVPATIPIPPGTQDSISCLYYVRGLPSLQPGFSQTMTVHHDKNNYRLEVRIEGIEKVRGPWGEVETLRTLVIMPFQGIFLNEGNIRVWLTNDERHIPVKMKAKVIVGSVVADLVEGWDGKPSP
ncbi:MAG: DUF3108 domain-containing protein [Nitrospira sp.]|nr:DUF3108 domain-containing protein [Nitrospira sp.]